MTDARRPWPPLIHADNLPLAVRWRDRLLTLFAWVGFAVFLDVEFKLSLGSLRALQRAGASGAVAHLAVIVGPDFRRLALFLLIGALLAALLFVRSVRTLVERSRALGLPQPAPLATADEARAAGLDEAALTAARGHRIVVVHEKDGRLTIEPGQTPPPSPSGGPDRAILGRRTSLRPH